jgi:hypothetical protein
VAEVAKGEGAHLREVILRVVANQLRLGKPAETKATLKRLMEQGYSKEEATRLIGCVVTFEMFDILKEGRPFDEARFVAALRRLPTLPDE